MIAKLLPLAGALLLIGTIARADDGGATIIGNATMAADGTITLDLYGDKTANYALAHIEYKTEDKDYQAILDHLGGLKPGERKPVPPWPEEAH
ncbi:MAG TPA: hypothetical protein VGF92_21170 [Stellaceae bacterium]|jgi:hypothetical protein